MKDKNQHTAKEDSQAKEESHEAIMQIDNGANARRRGGRKTQHENEGYDVRPEEYQRRLNAGIKEANCKLQKKEAECDKMKAELRKVKAEFKEMVVEVRKMGMASREMKAELHKMKALIPAMEAELNLTAQCPIDDTACTECEDQGYGHGQDQGP